MLAYCVPCVLRSHFKISGAYYISIYIYVSRISNDMNIGRLASLANYNYYDVDGTLRENQMRAKINTVRVNSTGNWQEDGSD